MLHQWLLQSAIKYVIAFETGHRAFNLHIQGVIRMLYPSSPDFIRKLRKIIKHNLPNTGSGYKIIIKKLNPQQSFMAMIGYCTKDNGKSHYQVRFSNVSPEDLSNGRTQHDHFSSSYDDDKKVITIKNFFPESWKYSRRCLSPIRFPIQFVLLYMIQSSEYVLSSEFISTYKKIDCHDAETIWTMVHDPSNTTLDMIQQVLFNTLTITRRGVHRYYVPVYLHSEIQNRNNTSGHTHISPYDSIKEALSAKALPLNSRGPTPLEGVLPLPEDPHVEYTLDYSPESPEPVESCICPGHVDKALFIVRSIRSKMASQTDVPNFPLNDNIESSHTTEEGFTYVPS